MQIFLFGGRGENLGHSSTQYENNHVREDLRQHGKHELCMLSKRGAHAGQANRKHLIGKVKLSGSYVHLKDLSVDFICD